MSFIWYRVLEEDAFIDVSWHIRVNVMWILTSKLYYALMQGLQPKEAQAVWSTFAYLM